MKAEIGHTQTILATPELEAQGVYGNCLQAAVATLLGMPLDAVPNFVAFQDYEAALRLWGEGEELVVRRYDDPRRYLPEGRCVYLGPSPRGYAHAVVGEAGDVTWDPHPSRAGLTSITTIYAIYRLEN